MRRGLTLLISITKYGYPEGFDERYTLIVIERPQSRVKRELTSIFRKIESGSLDMVEVTRNGRGIACIVRHVGDDAYKICSHSKGKS